MLKSLHISNYAIINHLDIELNPGLNIITGETGAGKSILLGALSLLLGQRADTSVLKNQEKKCVVEGAFQIQKYGLEPFFQQNDVDYDPLTLIRREIASNGKSRAFVNDVPVNLNVLKELGLYLIDIHSQHENLNLHNNDFQVKVIDTVAGHFNILDDLRENLKKYNTLKSGIESITTETERLLSEKGFFEFQYNELEKALLTEGEQEELEDELNALTHAEEIKELITGSIQLLMDNDVNILSSVKTLLQNLGKLKDINRSAASLHERADSVYIELKDILNEIETLNGHTIIDPERTEAVNNRLNLLYTLQQKHQAQSIAELIGIRDAYKTKLDNILFSDERLGALNQELAAVHKKMEGIGNQLTKGRLGAIPEIETKINNMLILLGMPSSQFKIELVTNGQCSQNGFDDVKFLFSAGKGIGFQDLAKTASGGEMSRLMLSIKSLITQSIELPTVIFDEIDSGISGEIADKMGEIIKNMSKDIQVINITHLPQIACKGDNHYLVQKVDQGNITETRMKLLTQEERVQEVAKMLSGAALTEAAIENAKVLLNS
jgi:DNA repair protein RecN (Recombination protein N)